MVGDRLIVLSVCKRSGGSSFIVPRVTPSNITVSVNLYILDRENIEGSLFPSIVEMHSKQRKLYDTS